MCWIIEKDGVVLVLVLVVRGGRRISSRLDDKFFPEIRCVDGNRLLPVIDDDDDVVVKLQRPPPHP